MDQAQLGPKKLLQSGDIFKHNPQAYKRFALKVFEQLKNQKLNIKEFNFSQAVKLLQLVDEFAPQDLFTYFNFFSQALQSNFYKKTLDINDYTNLITIFAHSGILTDSREPSSLYYHYLISLKEKKDKLNQENTVKALWNSIIGS